MKLKPWMKAVGILPAGAERAEVTLKHLMLACRAAGDADFMHRVMREAEFRVFELSKRDEKFQLNYLEANK